MVGMNHIPPSRSTWKRQNCILAVRAVVALRDHGTGHIGEGRGLNPDCHRHFSGGSFGDEHFP